MDLGILRTPTCKSCIDQTPSNWVCTPRELNWSSVNETCNYQVWTVGTACELTGSQHNTLADSSTAAMQRVCKEYSCLEDCLLSNQQNSMLQSSTRFSIYMVTLKVQHLRRSVLNIQHLLFVHKRMLVLSVN